jgi:nucleotide-binding universal stress UspA family protein
MYRKLLIPIDQPADVDPMIRFGSLILDADGEIRVLHVIPTISLPEVTRLWRASVNIVVPAHEAGAALDVRVDPEVRAAVDVGGEILESAESQDVDAILMTLRGNRRSRNPFVGHTASAVLHHAHCDVLVVNRLALAEGRIPRILVPTFSGAVAPKALRVAEEISVRNQKVPIIVLQMIPRGTEPSGSEEPERTPRGVPIEYRSSVLTSSLMGRRRRFPEIILAQALRERFGLLLVGEEYMQGEGPLLTRRFLGELFRTAPCPVVAVRA